MKNGELVEDRRPRFIFFDLESLRQASNAPEINKHILTTNLVVVQNACDDCRHVDTITLQSRCKCCGVTEHVFSGPAPLTTSASGCSLLKIPAAL